MDKTISNKYYIKAKDNYPYYLTAAIENLEYAIEYDESNSDANCMLAEIYLDKFENYKLAKFHLKEALYFNQKHLKSYYLFLKICILTNDLKQAKTLIKYAKKEVEGICTICINRYAALVKEKEGEFKKAKKQLKKVLQNYTIEHNGFPYELREDLSRINRKIKYLKSGKKKKSNKKKRK